MPGVYFIFMGKVAAPALGWLLNPHGTHLSSPLLILSLLNQATASTGVSAVASVTFFNAPLESDPQGQLEVSVLPDVWEGSSVSVAGKRVPTQSQHVQGIPPTP